MRDLSFYDRRALAKARNALLAYALLCLVGALSGALFHDEFAKDGLRVTWSQTNALFCVAVVAAVLAYAVDRGVAAAWWIAAACSFMALAGGALLLIELWPSRLYALAWVLEWWIFGRVINVETRTVFGAVRRPRPKPAHAAPVMQLEPTGRELRRKQAAYNHGLAHARNVLMLLAGVNFALAALLFSLNTTSDDGELTGALVATVSTGLIWACFAWGIHRGARIAFYGVLALLGAAILLDAVFAVGTFSPVFFVRLVIEFVVFREIANPKAAAAMAITLPWSQRRPEPADHLPLTGPSNPAFAYQRAKPEDEPVAPVRW